ncbi:MAG TPA: hypothetical protein VF516_37040 [Kofleriaceae bacterium]
MRRRSLLLAIALPVAAAACGSNEHPAIDASPAADAPAPDAPTCPTQLLTGGTDVGPQGWSVIMQPPATLTNGPDYVKLQTSTTTNATVSGQLLLTYPGAVEMGKLFKIQVVMQVDAVNSHNPLDSAAAILGSFTAQTGFGTTAERNQMIYLDAGKIGWADDSPSFPSFPFMVTDSAYHTYELSVDASGNATVTIDGTQALTRKGFTTNGAIAIGDQTNEPNVDSTLRIRSVTRLCL